MENAVVPQIRKINEMKESFIYGQPLTFGKLMEKITNLQEQFRALDVPKG